MIFSGQDYDPNSFAFIVLANAFSISFDFIGNDFQALVVDLMPNGSLDLWLHPVENQQHQSPLSLI